MRRCLHDKAGAVISLIVPCVDGGFIHWFHGRTRLHESPGRLDDNLIGELVPFEPDYRPVQHDIKGIPCVCVCVCFRLPNKSLESSHGCSFRGIEKCISCVFGLFKEFIGDSIACKCSDIYCAVFSGTIDPMIMIMIHGSQSSPSLHSVISV